MSKCDCGGRGRWRKRGGGWEACRWLAPQFLPRKQNPPGVGWNKMRMGEVRPWGRRSGGAALWRIGELEGVGG